MTGQLWAIVQAHIDRWGVPQARLAVRIGGKPQTLHSWRTRGHKQLPKRRLLKGLAAETGVPYERVLEAALVDSGYLTPRPDEVPPPPQQLACGGGAGGAGTPTYYMVGAGGGGGGTAATTGSNGWHPRGAVRYGDKWKVVESDKGVLRMPLDADEMFLLGGGGASRVSIELPDRTEDGNG